MKTNNYVLSGVIMMALIDVSRAGDRSGHAYADVIDVEPLYQTVRRPVKNKECWDEVVTHTRGSEGSSAAVFTGSIVGGLLGHQFGQGNGQRAATVVGAVMGGALGNELSRQEAYSYEVPERRCRVERRYVEERTLQAYRVTYEYAGQTYTEMMDHDPGNRVRVRVTVRVVE